MKISVERKMNGASIRTMCVLHNYCTMATNEEYSKILRMTDFKAYSDELVLELAEAIADVTDMRRMMELSGCSYVECIEAIAFNVLRECTETFATVTE